MYVMNNNGSESTESIDSLINKIGNNQKRLNSLNDELLSKLDQIGYGNE